MAYEEAAAFLARALPWPDAGVDPPEFYVQIWRVRVDDKGAKRWSGKPCKTLKAALNHVEWCDQQGSDVYVCMSGQSHTVKKTDPKSGREYLTATKDQRYAAAHKSFYFDVDVGKPTSKYKTMSEAMAAYAQFLAATGLPFPTSIVLSGTGFHAHTILDEPISNAVWQPLAEAFKAAALHHGFAIDPTCTADAARVLRVPNTWNHNYNPTKPVTLVHHDSMVRLDWVEQALAPYRGMFHVKPRAVVSVPRAGLPAGFTLSAKAGPCVPLIQNPSDTYPRLSELAAVCPFVAATVANQGAGYSQTLWYETAKLSFYLKEQEQALHAMGCGHAGYTPADTHAMFDRVVNERTPTDRWGWPRCATIENAGAPECKTCRFRPEDRSPIHFVYFEQGAKAAPIVTPEVTALNLAPRDLVGRDELPDGVELFDNLLCRRTQPDEKGDTQLIPIWRYVVREFWVTKDPWQLVFEVTDVTSETGWRLVALRFSAINDGIACARALGEQGFTIRDVQRSAVRDTMSSFVEMLRDRKDRVIAAEPSGWSFIDGKPDAFVYGRHRYNCAGDAPAHMGDIKLQNIYQPTGSAEPFKRAVKFIHDQRRPVLDAVVAASFGSVFMEHTNQTGLLISIRSADTGRGKSSALKVGQAVWGEPRRGINKLDDTSIGLDKKLTMLRNLPIFWDELQPQRDGRELIKTLFSLAQGKGKAKLQRNSQFMDIGTWSTLMIAASNDSLMAIAEGYGAKTSAAAYRILEFEVPPRHTPIIPEYATIFGELDHNYGHAGEMLARECGSHAVEMQDLTREFQEFMRKQLAADDAERLWIAGITSILLGATYANKLKLADFDIDALTKYLKAQFDGHRRAMAAAPLGIDKMSNKVRLLSDFINDPDNVVVATNICPAPRAGTPQPVTLDAPLDERLIRAIAGQRGTSDNKLRISKTRFEVFLDRKGYSRSFIKELEPLGLVKPFPRVKLCAGTNLSKKLTNTNEPVLEFDLNHPELQNLYN